MRRRSTGIWRRILAAWLAVFALAATAAPPAELLALREALQATPLEASVQPQALEHVDAALRAAAEAEALEARREALRREQRELPGEIARLQKALGEDGERLFAQWSSRLPRSASLDDLERLLERERALGSTLGAEQEQAAAQLASLLAQPLADVAEAQRALDAAQREVLPGEGEPGQLFAARRLHQAQERRRALVDLEVRRLDNELGNLRQQRLELVLRELRQRLAGQHRRTLHLQRRVLEEGRQELERLVASTAAELAQADDGDRPVRQELHELALRLRHEHESLDNERQALAELERVRTRVAATLRDSRARLEVGRASLSVGRWLWRERRQLVSPQRWQAQLRRVREQIGGLRLEQLALSGRQRALADGDRMALVEVVASSDDGPVLPVTDDRRATQMAQSLLTRLDLSVRRRLATLERSEDALSATHRDTLALQQLLDRHLLWIPSHHPVDAGWWARQAEGWGELLRASRLQQSAALTFAAMQQRPLAFLLAVALLGTLVLLQRQAPRRLEALAAVVRDPRKDRYRRSLQALGWTLLAASPWAVALYLAGHLLQQAGEAGRFTDSLGRALQATAPAVAVISLLRWLCIERGLAHAHLRWMKARREAIRHWLTRLAWLIVPTHLVTALALIRNQELAIDVQARSFLVLASLGAAFVAWQMLAPERLWARRGVVSEPSFWRRLLRLALTSTLLACAMLALAGYVYTAASLIRSLWASVGVVLAVALLHGLLGRWLVLGERRLALARADQRRDSEAEGSTGDATPEIADEITLEAVNAQSRRLLQALTWTLLALGLYAVWHDVLPALDRLDEWTLWQFSETAADGKQVPLPVSLKAALQAGLLLLLTVIASRNLPGLIEIALQSRVAVDAATRYAIVSVARYAIVITGTLFALSLFGLRWSQLQWMAAAFSVGLGFGLQEIFGNFVSGLILLFERPFRVGDVITIGNVTGTVTRIRTRATTVLDFDNKELVIPNKTFITGQLTNWTLTDSVTRLIVKVGVAYGSDLGRTQALLLDLARAHPKVLAEPPPRCWIMAFGDHAIQFELRVFVAAIADRLPVQDQLHQQIDRALAEAGVTIAFPQLDVHLHEAGR